MAAVDTEVGPSRHAVVANRLRVRREVAAWCALAIAALGIAGAFALLLAMSRVPGIATVMPWPVGFFGKGLVIHVVFSFVVWFLAAFAVLATAAASLTTPSRPATPP